MGGQQALSSRLRLIRTSSLGSAAAARFAGALVVALATTALAAGIILKNLNDAVATARLADAVGYFQARSQATERRWLAEADVFRVQLEFSRALDGNDMRLVRARLISFAESFGGANLFARIVLIGPTGEILARYLSGAQEEAEIPPVRDGTPVWVFDSRNAVLFRVFEQRILVNGVRCRLLLYKAFDGIELARMVFPGVSLGLSWQGQPVARSLAEANAAASNSTTEVERTASIAWGSGSAAVPAPMLEIRRRVPLAVSTPEVGIVFISAGLIIAFLVWLVLGRWLRETIARILALEDATGAFVDEGRLTSALEEGLRGAKAPATDEISRLTDSTLTMMHSVSEKNAELGIRMDELRESEVRFQSAFNLSPVPFILTALESGRILEISDQALTLLGYAREEAVGRSAVDLTSIAFLQERASFLEAVKRDGHIRNFPSTITRRSGERASVLSSADIIYVKGEACVLAALFDMTGLEQARTAIAESDERFRTAFRLSPIPFTLTALENGRVLEISDQALADLGLTREQAMGRISQDLWIWESPEERARFIALLAAQKHVRNYPANFKLPSGRVASVLVSAAVVLVKGEACVLAAILDTSDLKKVQADLAESRERYRVVIEAMAEGVIVHAADGSVVSMNQAAAILLGSHESQLAGEASLPAGWRFLNEAGNALSPEHSPSNIAIRTRSRVPTALLQAVHSAGHVKWLEVTALPLTMDSLGGTGALVTLSDRTAEVAAEGALRDLTITLEHRVATRTGELAAAYAELEAFSYSVSHDLRAPLRAIEGFSQLLLERHASALNDEAKGFIGRMSRGTQRMGAIIDDMLMLARISRTQLSLQRVDLTALAREIAKDLDHDHPEKKVDWNIAPGLVVEGDPGLLRIVLENLLGNARKYSAKTEAPVIRFYQSAASGSEDEFAVADNGAGFENAYVGQLFAPFKRLHHAGEYAGTGIGLATVKRIIDRHGGSVRAAGEVGKGATIWFCLPGHILIA